MFFSRRLVFGGTVGIGSLFHVLRSRSYFRRYRGCRVLFSFSVRSNSFSAVSRASGPFFMLCAPGLVFGGTEGIHSSCNVVRAWTRFLRFGGRQVPFSCFPLPNIFSTVPSASGPVVMFCMPRIIFGGIEGVVSRFPVFVLPDSFSAVPRASLPVFMFFALGHVFGSNEGVGFHFRRYRGRQVPFFCAPRFVFGGTVGVMSRFHILHSPTRIRRYRGRRDPFSRFALQDSFSTVSGRRVPFFCFARPDSFSTVPRASGPNLMFCSPRLVFGDTGGVGSRFLFFLLPDMSSTVPRASGPVFMFCVHRLDFGGT
jgi:hypothetical protein